LLQPSSPLRLIRMGTRYLTSDTLGSARVITTSSATVVSRHGYMPFGEEPGSGVGGRTSGNGFGVADGQRQKFAKKEGDIETGLGYFGARYLSSTQGRFTACDPRNILPGFAEIHIIAISCRAHKWRYCSTQSDINEPQNFVANLWTEFSAHNR
jgi:hypothetical protein